MNIPSEHAIILCDGNIEMAINFMFRCGPCNICGGSCLCLLNNNLLIERVLTKRKPVGTIPFRSKQEALKVQEYLLDLGLDTYLGKNNYNMYILVFTAMPIGYLALCQDFIEEKINKTAMAMLYGYPLQKRIKEIMAILKNE